MRLICPNCGAQYAVDERVIPDAGRDVQCSNCGNTWFQRHPSDDPDLSGELGYEQRKPSRAGASKSPAPKESAPDVGQKTAPSASAPVPESDVVEAVPEPETPAPSWETEATVEQPQNTSQNVEPAERSPSADRPTPEDEPLENFADEAELDVSPDPEPVRRPVDEAALAVLREEAAREQEARQAELGGLETQGELNITPPEGAVEPSLREQSDHIPTRAMPSDTLPSDDLTRSERVAPRRQMLPDVEEINSTLRPDDLAVGQQAESTAPQESRNRGRRIGMGLAFLVAGGLTLLYGQANRVSQVVPQAAPALESYVATVNSGRVWLDTTLREAVGTVQGEDG